MSVMSVFLVISLIFGCVAAVSGASNDWEDPKDIFGGSKSLYGPEMSALKEDLLHCKDELEELREGKCKGPRVIKQQSAADHYLQRLISLMLTSADFKNRKLGEGHEMRVHFDLYFNSEILPVLQAFGSGDRNGHSWSELDAAFVKVFSGDPHFGRNFGRNSGDPLNYSPDWDDRSHLTLLITLVGGFALCVIWIYLVRGALSIKPAIFVGLVLAFSFIFGWNFWRESEHIRMQNIMEGLKSVTGELPEVCTNPSNGLFGWFFKSSREQECINFLKAKNLHHMVSVDLAVVFRQSLQIAFSWIPALGHSAGEGISAFYGDSWVGGPVGFVAKVAAAPVFAVVALVAMFMFLVSRSTFRVKSLVGEISYGQRATDDLKTVEGRSLQDESENRKEKRPWKGWLKGKPKHRKSVTVAELYRPAFQWTRVKQSPKQRSEEKAFRELRRAYSTVERSPMDKLERPPMDKLERPPTDKLERPPTDKLERPPVGETT